MAWVKFITARGAWRAWAWRRKADGHDRGFPWIKAHNLHNFRRVHRRIAVRLEHDVDGLDQAHAALPRSQPRRCPGKGLAIGAFGFTFLSNALWRFSWRHGYGGVVFRKSVLTLVLEIAVGTVLVNNSCKRGMGP